MLRSISGIYRFFVRASAFVGKEMVEVLRQTPLILTLVLGPFLIMLLFGIGFRNEPRPLRTLIVMQEGDPSRQEVESMATSLGENLLFQGITSDRDAALLKLRRGKVDVVVVIPPDIYSTIKENQQAVVQFYHNEIDPYQVSYVEQFSNAYIGEVNQRILRNYAEQGQENASSLGQRLTSAHQRLAAMRQALQAGNVVEAQNEQKLLNEEIDAISMLAAGSMGLMGNLEANSAGSSTGNPSEVQSVKDALTLLKEHQQGLDGIIPDQANYQPELKKLDQLESDLTDLEQDLIDFQNIDPGVLMSPLRSEAVGLREAKLRPMEFFTPGVLVLLLQHLAITFSALAIVREQRSGTMELLRISPLSALEALLGKYLSYILFTGAIVAVLSATVVLALNVPMFGSWVDYGIVILALLFASLGIGFLLSLVAKTEMQAVQYAMFLLLGSIFFSGFFLDLRYLREPVRAISWMLPTTYAIRLTQDLMLRGDPINLWMLAALLGMGIFFFILAWFMLRRRLQSEWS